MPYSPRVTGTQETSSHNLRKRAGPEAIGEPAPTRAGIRAKHHNANAVIRGPHLSLTGKARAELSNERHDGRTARALLSSRNPEGLTAGK
jgi:hypothetical protein